MVSPPLMCAGTSPAVSRSRLLTRCWTNEDVRLVLEAMLRAMDRVKRPGETDREISLRGLSWIVNPYEDGGVVIAIEITMGAAVAGPFEIDKAVLESMIARVLSGASTPSLS